MKDIIKIIVFALGVSFFSCEKGSVTQCSDCSADEPVYTELEINIGDILSASGNIIINIYEGYLEDGVLISQITYPVREITYFEAQINKTYTVTATYKIGNRTYVAIDSAFPRVRYEADECDQPCYFVYNKSLNLRLKYQ